MATILSNGVYEPVNGQITNLKVTAYPTTLQAGFNTTVLITIINDFEPIYDVDVAVSFPQSQVTTISPVVIGTSNLKFAKVDIGKNVSVSPVIFVPKEAAGTGYQANIALTYKRLGYISPYSEFHSIGFYVKGQIAMVLYELLMEPKTTAAGSTFSLTGSLLNKGNMPALYTNASLLPHPLLELQPESYNYLGEIDPDSPTPFTLEAFIIPTALEGNYTLTMLVEYEDKEARVYSIKETFPLYIIEVEEQQTLGPTERIVETIRGELLFFIIIGVLILIIIGLMVRVRRSSQKEFEMEELTS
jgi:hypothetical protein